MTVFIKDTSSRNVFEAKASRYANAMALVPYARIMEMIWLSWFLPLNRQIMLDIMGGTGFISDLVKPLFKKTVIMDSVEEMFPPQSSHCILMAGDVTQEETFVNFKNQIDLAISLGGFHHIAVSDRQTEGLVKSWSSALKPNGRLIIADVPQPGQVVGQKEAVGDSRAEMPQAVNSISKWNLPEAVGTFSKWSFSLESTLKSILSKEPEPADFFDNVVAAKCPHGHEAFFQNPDALRDIFLNVGLQNISAFTISTPWLFKDRRQAAWFIHELFAFGGYAYDNPETFPQKKVDEVIESIKYYLGVVELESRNCIIGWKLMVVIGDLA